MLLFVKKISLFLVFKIVLQVDRTQCFGKFEFCRKLDLTVEQLIQCSRMWLVHDLFWVVTNIRWLCGNLR